MTDLQDMLRVQARLHRKQGANAMGDLFQSAALEIEILTERLETPQGLQELICVEQMKEMSLPEIHRANQKLHEQLAKANERVDSAEKEVERLRGLFHKWKQEKDNAVWESDIVFKALLSEMQVCPKGEDGLSDKEWWKRLVHQAINKFAIEKKVETLLEAREPFYQKEADLALHYGLNGTDCKKVTAWFDYKIEQLRKEQEQ